MNEGTMAILIQWSLLCLVWMGSFDSQLRGMGMERKRVLAVLCAFLICSFVSWQLFFAPIQVSLSGTLLPLFASVILYVRLPKAGRRLSVLGAMGLAVLLFWLRWLFFSDPILLFGDERVIVPGMSVAVALAMSKRDADRLFLLLLGLPMADVLYTLYFWPASGACSLGTDYAQDLLWSSISLLGLTSMLWTAIRRLFGRREAEPSHSDTGR
ncbi:YphA family membrane protein [Brevibacillus sp. SAFN-007a]|uniref:YphA family membrane protein n=1 Tax=Brevibacillus sp. SAFN-007a TaxID=3436862 RepID=UPI003F7F3B28